MTHDHFKPRETFFTCKCEVKKKKNLKLFSHWPSHPKRKKEKNPYHARLSHTKRVTYGWAYLDHKLSPTIKI